MYLLLSKLKNENSQHSSSIDPKAMLTVSNKPLPGAGMHKEAQTVAPLDNNVVDDLPKDQANDAAFTPLQQKEAASKRLNTKMHDRKLLDLNGKRCCVLISDVKSRAWQVSICFSKSPPVNFLCDWLAKCGLTTPNQTVFFDNGKQLGGCAEICNLFSQTGHAIEKTALASSSKIGQVK